MLWNFLFMASTIFRVGWVRPLKILLSEAGDMSMYWANSCWLMCFDSITSLILSFITS